MVDLYTDTFLSGVRTFHLFAVHPSGTASRLSSYAFESGVNSFSFSGCYLSDDFVSSGTYEVFGFSADGSGKIEKYHPATKLDFLPHGSPRPANIVTMDTFSNYAVAYAFGDQSPHQLGFYGFENITYYLEASQSRDFSGGVVRSSGFPAVNIDGEFEKLEIDLPDSGNASWHFRTFASNPLGSGSYDYYYSGDQEFDSKLVISNISTQSGSGLITSSGNHNIVLYQMVASY